MKNKKLFAILTLLCFLFTLMPVAAFAATAEDSYVLTAKKDLKMTKNDPKDAVEFEFDSAATTNVYIWVEETANVPSTALKAVEGATAVANTTGVYVMPAATAKTFVDGNAASMTIGSAGEYTLHAAIDDAQGAVATVLAKASTEMTKAEKIAAIEEYELTSYSGYDTITVKATSTSSSKYVTTVEVDNVAVGNIDDDKDGYFESGEKVEGKVTVPANSVGKKTINVTVAAPTRDEKGVITDTTVVKGADVEISTSSDAIEVSDEALTTNVRGQVEFDVTGITEGTYYVYVNVDSYEVRIEVEVASYDAAYIETIKELTSPVALDSTSLAGFVEFEITDINGNVITAPNSGMLNAVNNDDADQGDGDYVKFVSKPADSDLEDTDLTLAYLDYTPTDSNYGWTIKVSGGLDAEGDYEFKVILDNGKAAYAKVTVKEFQYPVALMLTYKQEAVELGGTAVRDKLKYVDANGVTKDAKDAELAATGYAIEKVYANGNIDIKDDEKYVGSEINVIAVSERYDLTATATIKVTADAAELQFASKTAEVDVNNKIDVQLVDGEGNKVVPTGMTKQEIKYVILDKPEGAKVNVTTASDSYLASKGLFTMSLTSDTIGNVAVQAILKYEKPVLDAKGEATGTTLAKYYTGTQIFAVGNGSVGDVVVMSIGSNEIVINDAKATIDAAPIVENNRTFVPFRALAEAFGATVAYDEATQAVTAELNGTTVVMTIGSATYTVNGVEKTADVAPFINGSRTMVPVRFAAEAFGIKVIPTYDENGATADILFNL